MQMIDVMKRLAALDATNPNVIDTNLKVVSPTQDFSAHERTELAECGMMPEMMSQDRPNTPASFNMTAATGEELSGMLKDIMSLAGLNKQPTDVAPGSMSPTPPAVAVSGPETSTDAMRSVIDKLNPDADTDGDGDGDAEDEEAREGMGGVVGGGIAGGLMGGPLGAAAGGLLGGALTDEDAEEETEEGWKGQLAGGTAGTLAGAAAGSALGPIGTAVGGALGGTAGQMMGDKMGGEEGDQDQEAEEDYDNTPADPRKVPEFDSEEYAHQENQPGSGNTANGQRRTTSQPTATYESLMKDYRQFIGETADEDDDVEEGMMDKAKAFGKKVLDKVGHGDDEDMIKDLQKKAGVPQTGKKPEKANESMADILRLSGLR